MTAPALPTYAVDACREYEHWASEIPRLTDAIGAVRCPNETWVDDEHGSWLSEGESCFHAASQVTLPAGSLPDDGDRPIRLDEIANRVADCPACSELVDLIRARRHARKRWGVAKRRVRAAGKRAIGGRP